MKEEIEGIEGTGNHASSVSGQGDEAVPKWAQALIDSQMALTSQLSAFVVNSSGTNSKDAKSTVPVQQSVPSVSNNRKRKPSLPREDDSDDFDARFGHLFEQGVCDYADDQDDDLDDDLV